MEFKDYTEFLGKDNPVFFIGVVESDNDPLSLGRVQARAFNFHTEDRTQIPTIDLPWAIVLQQSASNSGIGHSPNYLKPGSWVYGMFLDGENAQYPIIFGSIPRMHLPSSPADFMGNSGAGYRTSDSLYSGATSEPPYAPVPNQNPGPNAVVHDDGAYITKQNIPNWPFQKYTHTPARADYGLGCKDADQSLRIHKASVLALEQLGKTFGTYPKLNSAYRTPAYNATLKGAAPHSQHIQGRAFDCRFDSIGGGSNDNLKRFAQCAVKCGFVGFGIYDTFIHIDTWKGRTWNNRSKQPWFINALKEAGWYPGKPGLSSTQTNPGTTTSVPADTANNTTTTSSPSSSTSSSDSSSVPPTVSTPGGPAPSFSASKQQVVDYMQSFLTGQGYTPEQRAAILGNAWEESDFNPNIGQIGSGVTNADTTMRGGYGLFQWDDRKIALFNYTGTATPNAQQQMEFFQYEMETTEKAAGNALKAATTVEDANRAMQMYERYGTNSFQDRLNKSLQFYNGTAKFSTTPQGFADPSGSYPKSEYKGKPSTHPMARGLNGNMLNNNFNKDDRLTGMPHAGDRGTIGEVPISEGPQYPYNYIVHASDSGHILEMDDTPGMTRVSLQHKTGSRLAIGNEGTTILKSKGNLYTVSDNDEFNLVGGEFSMSVKDDINMRTTSDMTLHSDGTLTLIIRNDSVEHTSGKKDVLVGETLQIKANKIIVEANEIDFTSHGNIVMEAEGDIKMRAGGNINTSSGSDTTVFSKGGFHADAGSLNWLTGQAKEVPEQTSKSTDLGQVPARSKILKNPYKRESPDSTSTVDDAMDNYSASDPTNRSTQTTSI